VRVVLDTNVILAALATRGLCEAVVMVCLNHHEMILSQAILDEVTRHLAGKFKMPAPRVVEISTFLRAHSEWVVPAEVPVKACRDPDDRPILGTAVAGGADCLVTGDADLLARGQYANIRLLSPRDFYERLL
jgi:uncharacterized protein